ncbi:MAG: hypothetical protein C0403_06840 [Desulfobacterium sp.]|nr:hypothetical protein [Desulfobacterium sp.]
MRKVIRISSFREVWPRKKSHQIIQGNDPILFIFLKTFPIAKMFFRPEEVHRTSRVWQVYYPSSKGDGNMADQPLRIF